MNPTDGVSPTATELLDKASSLPYGEEERDLLHEALALATETGDEDAEFRIRLCLTASYRAVEDSASFLTHFSAALGLHDRDPQRFPGQGDGSYPDLFWQYKHAIHTVTMSCVFSRAQADAMLDQMAAHFAAAGVPETAVDIERRDDAVVNGDPATVLALQTRIDTMGGGDPFDDCPTCQLAGRMDVALCTGDIQGAHGALMQILEAGDVGCVMEPESSLARFMLLALKNGDTELATYAQRTSAAANPRFQGLTTVGRHLEFLGVTGNYTRGLGLLQRYQRALTADPLDTRGAFDVLLGAWVLLAATERAGFGDVTVPGSAAEDLVPFYGERGTSVSPDGADYPVRELALRCSSMAAVLAKRYDERNGNDNFGRRWAEAKENSTLDIPLDLGSTNLLLQAETATPDATPPTGRAVVERLQLALHTSATHDAADLAAVDLAADPGVDAADLITFLGLRCSLFDLVGDIPARNNAHADYLAELTRQGAAEVPFLTRVGVDGYFDPSPEMLDWWREEARRLAPDTTDDSDHGRNAEVASWIRVTSRLAGVLLRTSSQPDAPEALPAEAHGYLDDLVTVLRREHLLDRYGIAAVNLFSMDLASGQVENPPEAYASLREELVWPHTVPLDQLFAEAASRAGAEDGFTVTDRLLSDLIDLGMREVTARVALGSVDHLASAQRFTEAAERAQLAVRELDAAGLPQRDATLRHGEMLVYAGSDAEGREILEPLLLPKLDRLTSGEAIAFSTVETDALFTLGLALKNTDSSPDAAAVTLLQTRDLAMSQGNPSLAVAAVTAFTDMAHPLGEFDAAVAELRRTLPAAAELPDDGWSHLRLCDRIAVTQADADDPAALDTLAENMERARNLDQRIYVQESYNRVLHTFGRLDECLAGCEKLARMILGGEDGTGTDIAEDAADMASAQIFQGAQYAAWSDDLPAAVTMLEKAVSVAGVSTEQLVGYYRSLAQLTGELGRSRESSRWAKKAEKLAATLGQ